MVRVGALDHPERSMPAEYVLTFSSVRFIFAVEFLNMAYPLPFAPNFEFPLAMIVPFWNLTSLVVAIWINA